VLERLAREVGELRDRGIAPGLGTIIVGDDGASHTYVANKRRTCEEIGMVSHHRELPADASVDDILAAVAEFNANPEVHGYLVQLPLPQGLSEEQVLLAVDPAKDADGLHPVNLGRLVMDVPGPTPCTPAGIVELLAYNGVPIEGRDIVVVGRGITVGRPLSLLLASRRPNCNAAVTVVHTGVPDLAQHTRRADIVVVAAGRPGLLTADMVKPGAAVVGAGITRDGRRILSDVADDVADVAGWVTPRIGGVGPMTVAMLCSNTVAAAANCA
jgi:methylenetetrahydrofolate dehydrogenase (NADP+)/methenyltetrahydrofolate cyclohydrolase